ncbi:uncharacterized protein LOC116347689 [Contarinia nasturtii]|uniref:uncharacterized protein LOC116347689 n=1 Tax=Contarinia nasturtii TaxID=265458 RepID=UPI0012D49FA2|nr:uncharacterized protein LOC116347689 [Contarinia nasturtii]
MNSPNKINFRKKKMTTLMVFILCFGTIAGTISESQQQASSSKEARLRTFLETNQTSEAIKLIEDGANVNFKYENGEYPVFPIHLAVEIGNLDIIKCLIENGVEVNAKDYFNRQGLHIASRNAREDIVKILIENGAEVKNNGAELLHWAISGGDLSIIKILIRNGAELNDDQLLLRAIAKDRADIVEALITNGANINTKALPLHAAVLKGDIQVIRLILEKGVENIDAKDNSGTALYYAALNPSISNNREIAKLLIQYGANIFATGTGQFTFYQWAEKDNFFFEKLQEAMTKQETQKKTRPKY